MPLQAQRTARLDVAADAQLVALVARQAGHLARPGRWLADRLERALARRPPVATRSPTREPFAEAVRVGRRLNAAVLRTHQSGRATHALWACVAALRIWSAVADSVATGTATGWRRPGPWVHRFSLRLPPARRDALVRVTEAYPWSRPQLLWALAVDAPWPAPTAAVDAAHEISRQVNNLRQVQRYGVDTADLVDHLVAIHERLLRPVVPT